MFYILKSIYFQTRNLRTPSISITSTISDQNNWHLITEELKAECKNKKYGWNFSTELCAELETCYDWWRTEYVDKKRQTWQG